MITIPRKILVFPKTWASCWGCGVLRAAASEAWPLRFPGHTSRIAGTHWLCGTGCPTWTGCSAQTVMRSSAAGSLGWDSRPSQGFPVCVQSPCCVMSFEPVSGIPCVHSVPMLCDEIRACLRDSLCAFSPHGV